MPTDELDLADVNELGLIRELPSAVLVTTAGGRIVDASPPACALLGFGRDELVGRNLDDLSHPDDRDQGSALAGRRTGEVNVDRRRMRRKDGRWITVHRRQRYLSPERILTAIEDVSELVDTHTALAGRERELGAMLELAGVAHGQTDLAGTLLSVNEAMSALTGYTREELVGRNVADLTHPDDLARDQRELDTVRRGERSSWTSEKRYVRKDGRVVWVLVTGGVIRDERGQVVHMVAIVYDISARKQFEQQLRASVELHRTLSEAVPDMIWMGDPTGVPEYVNRRWIEYTGCEVSQLDGEVWRSLVHPDDELRLRAEWAAAVAERRTFEAELRYRGADGRWRWFLGRAVPTHDEAGRVARWVGSMTDIDDRRRAMQALREADQHKDEFLAVLSHELRNPLAPIRTGLHVLQRAPADSDLARRTMQVIDRQVGHLARLVDDLLDVTRISRGKIRLHLETIDLVATVARTVEDHRATLDERQVALELHLPSEPVLIGADPTRVAQVVGNLLQNAAKFTPPGGRVDVTVDTDPGRALIRVRDTGVGIEEELLQTLFRPFTQAATALDRPGGGLGLGLALVKGLAELHGGSVEAHSEGKGRGAEFVVRLPREVAATQLDPASEAGPLQPRRVLVIEDNRDGAESLRDALAFGGHDVHVAFDGLEGLRRARELRPDVILCDIGLPGMNGYEIAREVRSDPSLHGTLLVALTGYGLPEDRRRASEAGFVRHLTKPTPLEELERILSEAPSRR